MEFERVLYRVHASTLASLERHRERLHVRPLNACWIVTELTFVVAVSLLLLSTALHASLERGNCLAPQLAEALRVQAPPGSNASDGGWRLPRDVVVKISLGSLPGDAELIAEANEVATRRLSSNGTDAARDDASRRAAATAGSARRAGGSFSVRRAKSLIAFFFMSTITALVIRVLVSSGVVAAFLLWYGLTSCGARLDFGALSLSYPWLGAAELLRAQRRPACPFVASHVVRVVLLYAAYEACQVAFSDWFYLGQRPLPKTLPLCVFGVALGWECDHGLRAVAPSIAYLPKLTLLYFLAAHGTFYALARPYALLNLAVAALLMAHAVLYVILEFELPAHARGDVDHETPRARHTELPWPALDAMLPPTWSLFMPLVPDDATGTGDDRRQGPPTRRPSTASARASRAAPSRKEHRSSGARAPAASKTFAQRSATSSQLDAT
ncbi:hypothetical protein JL721_5982 [Aureococcus anophagefferens]|nr:hypothetical protein JL721_5982 [Aureococcus anophagefferens]